MATDVRVGGAFVTLGAQTGPYVAGMASAAAANRNLVSSYGGFNAQISASNRLFQRFSASISSSLIATAAYAAGVGLVASSLRAVTTGYLDYDQALIRISKTTGVANEELERLGRNLVSIGTDRFRGRRALDVSREDIFNIAVAAGQAGVSDPGEIELLARTAAALQSSSDLIGTQAVRAITRYLNATGQAIDRSNALASALTAIGNNAVVTESEIARFGTRVAQNLSSVGGATDQFILGASTALAERGLELEASGSALQRAQQGLLRAAADQGAFRSIAELGGESVEVFEELRQRMVAGTHTLEDLQRLWLAFLRAINRLPDVSQGSGVPTVTEFITSITGGGENNVRVTRVLGLLGEEYENVVSRIGLAGDALENQSEHLTEAERASEAYRARLDVVGRQMEDFGTTLGEQVVPSIVLLAENLDLLGAAALAGTAALAIGFGQRRVRAIREAGRAARDAARQQVAAAQTAVSAARQQQDAQRRRIVAAQQVTQASRQVEQQQRTLAATYLATERARRRLTTAESNAARVQRNFAQLGRPAADRAGIAVAAAQAEVDRQLRRQAAAQRQLTQTQAVIAAGGRPQDTRQLLRGLRQYQDRANRTRAAVARLAAAQQNLAAVTRTVGQRFAALGRGLFNFFGGPLGLVIGGFAALQLILSSGNEELSEAEQRFPDVRDAIRGALEARQQEAAGLTDEGQILREAGEVLSGRRLEQQTAIGRLRDVAAQIFEDGIARSVALGASPEAFERARQLLNEASRALSGDVLALTPDIREPFAALGLGEQFDEILSRAAQIRELEDDTSDLAEAMGATGDAAAQARQNVQRTFRELPASVLAADQAVQQFLDSLADARQNALDVANLDLDLVGQPESVRIYEELLAREARLIEQRQRAARRARDNADALVDELDLRRAITAEQVNNLHGGADARVQAERSLAGLDRQLVTARANLAVREREYRLLLGIEASQEEIAEAARRTREAQIAVFREQTRLQVVQSRRPDLAGVEIQFLRDRLDATNALSDAIRDLQQAQEVASLGTRRERAAQEAYNRVINEYRDQIRDVEQQLRINERAIELATQRRDSLGLAAIVADDPLAPLAEGAADANAAFDSLAQGGVRRFGDALAGEIAEGEAGLRRLIDLLEQMGLTGGGAGAGNIGFQNIGQFWQSQTPEYRADIRESADLLRRAGEGIALTADELRQLLDIIERRYIPRAPGEYRPEVLPGYQEGTNPVFDAILERLRSIDENFDDPNPRQYRRDRSLDQFFGQAGDFGFQLAAGRRAANDRATRRSEFTVEEFSPQAADVLAERINQALVDRINAGAFDRFGAVRGESGAPRRGVAELRSGFTEEEFGTRAADVFAERAAQEFVRRSEGGAFARFGSGGSEAERQRSIIERCLPLDEFEDLKRRVNEVFGDGGDFGRFLDQAEAETRDFTDRAGNTLEGFFLRDVLGFFRDIELPGNLLERERRAPPAPYLSGFRSLDRAFEVGARDRALAEQVQQRTEELNRQLELINEGVQELIERAQQPVVIEPASPGAVEPVQTDSIQELLERAREPIVIPEAGTLDEGSRRTNELLEESNRILEQIRRQREEREQREDGLQPISFGVAEPRRVADTPVPHLLPDDGGFRIILHEFQAVNDEIQTGLTTFARSAETTLVRVAEARNDAAAAATNVADATLDVTNAQLEQQRVAETDLARLRAERDELRALLEDLKGVADERERLARDAGEAAAAGILSPLDRLAQGAALLSDNLEELAANGIARASDELASFIVSGEADFRAFAQSIIQELVRILIQAQIVAPLLQALGFGGGGAVGATLPAGFTFFHEGGKAGSSPGQRLHRPHGLRHDEIMAVLQRGEIVLPRALARRAQIGGPQDQAAIFAFIRSLPRFHDGGAVGARGGAGNGAAMPTRIELINQTGTRAELIDGGVRLDVGGAVQSFFLRDVQRSGPMTQALGQRFGLGLR